MNTCRECGSATLPCPMCCAAVHLSTRDEAPPVAGDLSVCDFCSGYVRVANEHQLVLLTRSEIDALPKAVQEAMAEDRRIVMKHWTNQARVH